jgi:hypothetical protein
MRAGDKVKLIGVPPGLRDADGLDTRTLFEKCLGLTFVVAEMETVEGVPYPLAKLYVGHVLGEPEHTHSIWVEPEYLEIVD